MRMSDMDFIIALAHSARNPVGRLPSHQPSVPSMADFVAWATRKQDAHVRSTGTAVDGDGWQDWPPHESPSEPSAF